MKYGDLNLGKLRDDCGLDFAHYTYKKNQCSCCYGPRDQARIHWRNQTIIADGEISYILYKNAYNCGGCVSKEDEVNLIDYVSWSMPDTLLPIVCKELSRQYGKEFRVFQPKNVWHTILIVQDGYSMRSYRNRDSYTCYYKNGRKRSLTRRSGAKSSST